MEKFVSICIFVLVPLLWGLGTDAFFERLHRWRRARQDDEAAGDDER